ncbi:MAG TPA: adenosylmethionine--8-amino-7-oxononanoate transaminase [Rhodocyclaceae bacterium]|jgi:adenosylmethionine-8-amino-7-oxononanoate aminotransferase|nr:adenosylmethionine--8-amino-7-oxononanoate transaminase [Rhodocyclaceae bacterium]
MSAQANLQLRSLAAVWHPCTQMKRHEALPPLAIARGEGAWLYDFEGQRYLDGISSWWVNLFGHAHPQINAALKDQLDTLAHAMLSGCTHAPVVELSERLSALTGHQLGHCFYASDGASAVEIALKMSFHFWRNTGKPEKREFVCLKNSYHGETLGALSVTDVELFRDAYDPLLRHAHIVATPDARLAATPEAAAQNALAELEQLFATQHAQIAAFIVEPLIQCATGMAMYDPLYLREARRLCDQYQVHLIADEIAVGCGRTGTFFACEQANIWPDFICLSKGISAGYLPLSLVMSTDQVYAAFYDDDVTRGFLHSHSYTGNPMACRAALAALDVFESEQVLATNKIKAAHLTQLLHPLASDPRIKNFRNRGMIWAFDAIVEDKDQAATFSSRFHSAALAQGVLLRPIGTTVYLMPPYILDITEQAHLATATINAFNAVMSI